MRPQRPAATSISSPVPRTLRILAAYLEPDCRFERERVEEIIVFFGSRALQLPKAEKLLETVRFGERARIMEACRRRSPGGGWTSAHRTRKLEEVLVSLPQRSRPVTSSRYSPGARSSST